jgi:predicted transcriptional regulator
MKVRAWMEPDPPTVLVETPVEEAQKLAQDLGLALVLVVDEGEKLVGFLTRKALDAAPKPDLPAGKLAAQPTVVLQADDPVERALALLVDRYAVLPVLEGERLVGVITRGGALRALVRMTGIGEEGTRIRLKLQDHREIYRVLAVLSRWGLELVSVTRGEDGEVVLHVRGLEDKDGLMRELEETLG